MTTGMARNTGGSRSAPASSSAQLLIGVLIGAVLGLVAAGVVAWKITKGPSPFAEQTQRPANDKPPASVATAPPATPPPAAASTNDGKQRFDFYHILTEKEKAAANTPPAAGKNTQTPTPPPGGKYYLQAASFVSEADADKLKARLALAGLEASIQPVNIPDKGMRYRVRLGPYANADQLRKADGILKQNGIMNAQQVQ
jgi:cell division protein FtsN